MTQTGIRSACTMMKEAIEYIQQQIESKLDHIGFLRERIAELQGRPQPDLQLIASLEERTELLERELESDISQRDAYQNEYSAHCVE
ncbi:hypothetical protein [Streptomyces sp. 8N706]|uniref:hypothetical protein n=1 Tax=Streptomyces sp. 8N706 TaxID=3457416 RepID=UPI003FD20F28